MLTHPRQRDSGVDKMPDIVGFSEIAFIDVPDGPIANVDGGVEAALPLLFKRARSCPRRQRPSPGQFHGGH